MVEPLKRRVKEEEPAEAPEGSMVPEASVEPEASEAASEDSSEKEPVC